MTEILQSTTSIGNIPEIKISVTPTAYPIAVATDDGIYRWPNLYTGTTTIVSGAPPNMIEFITPYIGSTVSGTLIRPEAHQYEANKVLTFSGAVNDLPPNQSVTSYNWNFGDGFTSAGNPVTHTYKVSNPATQASLTISLSDGREYSSGQLVSIYRAIEPKFINYVEDPNFDHDSLGTQPHLYNAGNVTNLVASGAVITVTSGWYDTPPHSLEIITHSGAAKEGTSISLGDLTAGNYYLSTIAKGQKGGEKVTIYGGTSAAAGHINVTLSSEPQTYAFGFTTAGGAQSYFAISTTEASSSRFNIDNVMVTASGIPTGLYVDGDQIWCVWLGPIPGASKSGTLKIEPNKIQF